MCRSLLLAVALLISTSSLHAQDAKPNTLTPKEIADGWILLFDGETTFGWNTASSPKIASGAWTIPASPLNAHASVQTNAHFGDGVLAFEFNYARFPSTTSRRDTKQANAYVLYGGHHAWKLQPTILPTVPPGVKTDGWINATLEIRKGRVVKAPGSAPTPDENETSPSPAAIGFGMEPEVEVVVRNVKFRPDAGEVLFNSKDLTGWKVFPGKKSEFSVKDGAIQLKNGPGDLQTEKQFGDFCLQLECKSNGPHLNSGVFFRCRPNEYQNGYECQIRNQFTEKPTQKYVLEDYDPQTHKLLGKKEAFYTAVDYGTGAIYRRQPARKEVAKDHEWFTMAIIVQGNHFATWVNGIQVTDWTDNRPPSDNARTGFRREAGHISLQGHDPTTDLSFRNFRIQEYPR